MMYGSLRFFEAFAILCPFVLLWFAYANRYALMSTGSTPLSSSGKQACLGFRAFDPYIILYD